MSEGTSLKGAVASVNTEPLGSACQEQKFEKSKKSTTVPLIIKKYMPGSLTILVKAKENVPDYVTHSTKIIGIRIPSNKEALDLLTFVKKPLLVPSANKADQKPALNDEEVKPIFKDEIKVVIPGKAVGGQASTIIDLTGNEIKLIRKGPISLEELNLLLN